MQLKRKYHKKTALLLAVSLIVSLLSGLTANADTWPDIDSSMIKSAQPHFSGYRVRDIEVWDSETDPYADLMQAKVPLQKRNEPFRPTQVNPKLTAPVEVMLMQGDYGNSFFDSTIANNTYGHLTFPFWQYTDYFSPWHGAATIGTPRGLYDPANSDWQNRGFEFGIVNIPNQAYINAAHKNGVMAIACVYFDPAFRPGQTKQEMFRKDENGKYIVANKLIELARYYGIDGYFLNDEERGADEFKPLMAQITASGLWTQFYDINSSFDSRKSQYLKDDTHGKIHDSVFVNYGWSGVDDFVKHAKDIGVDPYKAVFLGIEANQGRFANSGQTAIANAYDENKNPKMSVALFTPSDMYQRGVDELMGSLGLNKVLPLHQRDEYQWMVAERERMYFSGVKIDPTDTGKKDGYSRNDVAVSDASGWVGVADFKSEASVISGQNFYSNFNFGKGMQYFADGKVATDEAWTNLNDQDILPTWQWWFETTASKKLKADFDFGAKEVRNDRKGTAMTLPYTQVGAWHGGNSLVVYGDLEAGKDNFLHVFKTNLDVVSGSQAKIHYRKSSQDNATMQLGLILQDDPTNVVKLDVTGSQTAGEWQEAAIDLSAYNGKKIAAIGFVFRSDVAVEKYQMNIGQVQVTNSKAVVATPENFRIEKIFDDGQVIFRWTRKEYSEVDKYRVYAKTADGTRRFLGGIYDDSLYAKNHFVTAKEAVTFELVAVGKDGVESSPAQVVVAKDKMPHNIVVKEKQNEKTKLSHATELGKLDITWEAVSGAEGYELHVKPLWLKANSPKYKEYTQKVAAGTTNYVMEVPEMNDGIEYDLTISPIISGKAQLGMSYRGRFYDGYAEPLTEDDVIFYDKKTFSMRSPLTRDWHILTVDFVAKNSTRKVNIMEKERGVSRLYHEKQIIPSNSGTLLITLKDYNGNASTLELVFDESYKDVLVDLVDEYMAVSENIEIAKKLYSNTNLEEILPLLKEKLTEAKAILDSSDNHRDRVPVLEQEIREIVAKLQLREGLIVLNLKIDWTKEARKTNATLVVTVKDSQDKKVDMLTPYRYIVEKGTYKINLKDTRYYILPVEKTVEVTETMNVPMVADRWAYEAKLTAKPTKTTYERGESLDLTGGTVRLNYYNPTSFRDVPLSDEGFVLSGYRSEVLGEQEITATGFGYSVKFNVTVVPNQQELKELAALLNVVEEARKIKSEKAYLHAGDELKTNLDEALAEAEKYLPEQDKELNREEVVMATKRLKKAMIALDGEKNAPLEITTWAQLDVHGTNILSKILDKDPESYAWLAGAQKAGDDVGIQFSKPVSIKGITLKYPKDVSEDYIYGADVEVWVDGAWKKVGEVAGKETQTVAFEAEKTMYIHLKITKEVNCWYKIGEIELDYSEITDTEGQFKKYLRVAVANAEKVKQEIRYFNASDEVQAEFDQAIEHAKAELQRSDATEEEFWAAIEKLSDSEMKLDGKAVDITVLQELVNKANEVKETALYTKSTPDKQQAFDEKLAAAEELLAEPMIVRKEMEEALAALRKAMDELNGPKPEVLLPYIPEVIAQEPAPEVKIEDEEIALSTPEAKEKMEQLGKDFSKEADQKLLKEWLAGKKNVADLAKKLTEEGIETFAKNVAEKFQDEKTSNWYNKELGFAVLADLIKGYPDGTFGGSKEVTGKELVTMLVRANESKVDKVEGDWFAPFYKTAEKEGLLKGLEIDLAKPLTRQEVAALAYNFLMMGKTTNLLPNRKNTFTDQEQIAAKYLTAIDYLWDKGILKGYEDGSFRPNTKVSRQEIVAILYRLLQVK